MMGSSPAVNLVCWRSVSLSGADRCAKAVNPVDAWWIDASGGVSKARQALDALDEDADPVAWVNALVAISLGEEDRVKLARARVSRTRGGNGRFHDLRRRIGLPSS